MNTRTPSFAKHLLTLVATVWICAALVACGAEDLLDGPDGGMEEDTFTMIFNSSTFQRCGGCHAPGAPGFDPAIGTEASQDWSSRNNAIMSLRGNASGLTGNVADCNGVPFIGDTPETSLLVAVLDEDVRRDFSLDGFAGCDGDAITDMNLKLPSPISAAELGLLKQWISDGAPNQ